MALRGHDKGKPVERRGRKTTRLKRTEVRHAGRASEWHSFEDQTVNIRIAASLGGLLLGIAACTGAESTAANSGLTSVTGLSDDTALAPPLVTPPAPIPPTTTAPIPTPPPAGSGTTSVVPSFSGPGLSGLALVSDDFRYQSTADLLNRISTAIGGTSAPNTALYGDGTNVSLAEIDKNVTYNGHGTLKYNQPGGVFNTPVLSVHLPHSVTHLWYRVKVRFSPGFTTTGTLTNSANAYKLLSWGWDGSGLNGSGRLEITNTIQYQLYENVQTNAGVVGGGAYLIAGNISTEWTDGGWYDYIIEVDHSVPSGIIRLWRSRDGQTPVYIGQKTETMMSGALMPALTGVSVGLNFNQTRLSSQNQAIWWGQWEVVDGAQHPNPFGVTSH